MYNSPFYLFSGGHAAYTMESYLRKRTTEDEVLPVQKGPRLLQPENSESEEDTF